MQITVQVPEALGNLPSQEQNMLIQAGLGNAASARIQQLHGEIKLATEAIHRFERKYGVTFDHFENEMLPELDTLQAHEDYNDWFYWVQVRAEKELMINGQLSTVNCE